MENTDGLRTDRHTEKAAQIGEVLHLMGTAIAEQKIQLSRSVKAREAGHMLEEEDRKGDETYCWTMSLEVTEYQNCKILIKILYKCLELRA